MMLLDCYKDGYVDLHPSYIRKKKLTNGKYCYYIEQPQIRYRSYSYTKYRFNLYRNKTNNACRKFERLKKFSVEVFINEDCCFCGSSIDIVKHHEDYDVWNCIYFMCKKCHNLYHSKHLYGKW